MEGVNPKERDVAVTAVSATAIIKRQILDPINYFLL